MVINNLVQPFGNPTFEEASGDEAFKNNGSLRELLMDKDLLFTIGRSNTQM